VVPVIVATLLFAWWYRSSNNRASRSPDESYEGRVEFVVWSIPALTVILLGGVIWIGSHQLDPRAPIPAKSDPLRVNVVSLDWKWLFIYPAQGVASVNQLVLPAGVPVHFSLTSASVLNTFFVPQLGSMIYTMNGMRTQLNLRADRQGTFHGQSSHYSGDGFSDMHFDVHAVTPEQLKAQRDRLKRAAKKTPLLMSGVAGTGVKEALRALVEVIGEAPVSAKAKGVAKAEPWAPQTT